MGTISVSDARAFDQYTIRKIGIPSLVLMERAALASVENIFYLRWHLNHVLIIAGSGNNGGDGLAVGRLLKNRGFNVDALLVGNPKHASIERTQQLQFAKHYGVNILPLNKIDWGKYTVIVDAVFGTGLSRNVGGSYPSIIQEMNDAPANKFSIDVPSGLNADTGEVMGISVKADATATFAYAKQGMVSDHGKKYCGRLFVDDIGIYDPKTLKNN